MWILRLILVLLGFLLLRRLLGVRGGGRRSEPSESSRTPAPPTVPFSEADIQDADFEEVDERRDSRKAGR